MQRVCFTRSALRGEREMLDAGGGRIAVIAIDGPLFFGAAETVARAITNAIERVDWLVLDFRRVSRLDSSGVVAHSHHSLMVIQG
jgi:sulfate permease, SulP family